MATVLPFSLQWYLTNNPDVALAVSKGLVDAFEHFQNHGKAEGRSASPLFNAADYLAKSPDVAAAVARGETTAYDHFVTFGASEGRAPSKIFDEAFYLLQNPDVAAAVNAGTMTAVQHFLAYGQSEPRPFNPSIDLGAYLKANPDVATAVQQGFTSAMGHLLQYGVTEPRDLGNGINLGAFANDPDYKAALQSGDFQGAIERVGEVAPFLSTFVPPANWTAPADTHIPLDFVPPAGVKLVVPPGVVIPDGTVLPPSFEPVTPPVDPSTPVDPAPPPAAVYADLTGVATTGGDFLYAGNTNPANDFFLSTNTSAGIQVGLDFRYKGIADDIPPETDSNVFLVDSTKVLDARFAYTVAQFDPANDSTAVALNLSKFSYQLKIDTDSSDRTNFLTFDLVKQNDGTKADGNHPSPYEWVAKDSTLVIYDDGGTEHVTQNIQALQWYQEEGTTPSPGGQYTVQLDAYDVASNQLVASSSIIMLIGTPPNEVGAPAAV